MRRGIAIAVVMLGGCLGNDDGPPVDPPGDDLPPGIWEPIPHASIRDARLALDGDAVWWAVSRRIEPAGEYLFEDAIWLTATSTTGASLVAPAKVSLDGGVAFDPDVAVTPSAVIAKAGGNNAVLQRYDHAGVPLGEPSPVVIHDGGRVIAAVSRTKLVATPDGGVQFLATLADPMHEVALVEMDAAGAPQRTSFAGTPATAEGGTTAYTVSAAVQPDGSTIVAWDRGYNGCISNLPADSLTTTFDDGSVGTVAHVYDAPDSEVSPAIAGLAGSTYVAWISTIPSASGIELARHPDVTTVLAEVGAGDGYISELTLVLGAPDRGLLVWRTGLVGVVHVQPFEDRGGTIVVGAALELPRVDATADASGAHLVHLDGNRYLVAWTESKFVGLEDVNRLFATEIDVTSAMLRAAPAPASRPEPRGKRVRPRRPRCV